MSKTLTFSYLPTKLAIVGSIIAACSLMVTVVVFGINPNQPTKTDFGGIQYPASLSSLASGCGDLYLFDPSSDQYGVIPEKVTSSEGVIDTPIHTMTVPVYGYMSAEPLGESQIRFYAKDELKEPIAREKILRAMYEKNTTAIWYSKDIGADDYQMLKEYVESHKNIIATKWEYASGDLPLGRKIAFSSWGMSQSCEFWTNTNFDKFQDFKKEHNITKITPVPLAKLNKSGLLPAITQPSTGLGQGDQ